MIDIHTHLYFPDYDDDRDETIARAFAGGIEIMISVGTSPKDHAKAIAITEKDSRIFAAIGLHPHWFDEQYLIKEESQKIENLFLSNVFNEMRGLIRINKKIIAIGECGLDYFTRDGSALSDEQKLWQKEGFLMQMKLARELNLPMIVHTRPSLGSQDAYEDMFAILRENDCGQTVLLHCYVGDTEMTRKFLTLPSVSFSFTGVITYPVKKLFAGTKDDIRESIKCIPTDRLFAETDCPFLAPQSFRGKRNEPIFVAEIMKKLAEIKECSLESLEKALRQNVQDVLL